MPPLVNRWLTLAHMLGSAECGGGGGKESNYKLQAEGQTDGERSASGGGKGGRLGEGAVLAGWARQEETKCSWLLYEIDLKAGKWTKTTSRTS